jgi:hypothetical protein
MFTWGTQLYPPGSSRTCEKDDYQEVDVRLHDEGHREVVVHGEQSRRCTLPKNLIACKSQAGSQGSKVPKVCTLKLYSHRSLRREC